ncbi:MAG: cellulase family glycosylhydrolase [Bacteroidaceae bacterium]|nr:cellulase family glycosylhydrolase [Bacteroidaceae bacterium]
MKRFVLLSLLTLLLSPLASHSLPRKEHFITVRNGQFFEGNQPYRFIGANLWYGAILASEGKGGNLPRLQAELDNLQALGVTNLRILVGAEGTTTATDHIQPTLQPQPGEYNDTLLRGLDRLMVELHKRHMRAVLYLHNAWQWSGGFGIYLKWAGMGEPAPAQIWNQYTSHTSQFHHDALARAMALHHTLFIVTRRNTITGQPYATDPTLMAWEICNEPRPFARDTETKAHFQDWIREQSEAIRRFDPNHLITTGSEGKFGCEMDIQLFERIHALPTIDYLCIHIWPYTWTWLGPFISPNSLAKQRQPASMLQRGVEAACRESEAYIREHVRVARQLQKPIVLEEFGYPRDGFEIAVSTPTSARDQYYKFILSQVNDSVGLSGCNFWAWGGKVRPPHPMWQPWDPYTGDPAQEEQGLYSVFQSDSTTLSVIRQAAARF